MASKIGPAITIILCGVVGVVLAFIEKTLYDNGTFVTALANMGITIIEAMTLTIVLSLLVGCIIAPLRS